MDKKHRFYLRLKKMLETILQLLYPNFCPECKIIIHKDEIFCEKCIKKIKPIVSHFIKVNQSYSMPVFAVSDYKNPLKSLILKKTFSQSWASIKLAQVILSNIDLSCLEVDYIVAIPLHWTRYAHRGFNQAEIMAKFLGKKLDKPFLNILKRTKKTKFQSSLPVEQRIKNLSGAFEINKNLDFIKNKNILLVDDLCTTGATLRNAAKVFAKFKPKSISAVVACRVV